MSFRKKFMRKYILNNGNLKKPQHTELQTTNFAKENMFY